MYKVKYLESLKVAPKRDMILYRLGYRKDKTILNDAQSNSLQRYIDEGILFCNSKAAFLRLKIEQCGESYIKLENDIFLTSKAFARYLKASDELVIMASTVGKEIMEEISQSLEREDAGRALVLDSVGSQMADATLDAVVEFLDKLLIKEGKKTAETRYSPGYGDFELQNQKILFEMLKLEKIGLYLTEKYMLVPEKSVIAVVGIERI